MAADPALDAVLGRLDEQRRSRRTVMSTSADRAARTVREQVNEGALRSGTRLPEERLAQALGVSRNTLREALSQLVSERILVREANRGVVVATPAEADVADVYQARRMIESGAILLGTAHDAEHLEAVSRAVEEGRAADARGDWDGVASANQHFHRAVVALGGSSRLDSQMDLLLAEMRLFFHQMSAPEDFHRPYLEENLLIAEHLRRGERAKASDRLVGYLSAAEQQLRTALGSRALP